MSASFVHQRLPFSTRRRGGRAGRRALLSESASFPVVALRFAFLGIVAAIAITHDSGWRGGIQYARFDAPTSFASTADVLAKPSSLGDEGFMPSQATGGGAPAYAPAAEGPSPAGSPESTPRIRPCPTYQSPEEMAAAAVS